MKKKIYLIAATILLTLAACASHAADVKGGPPNKGVITAMTVEQKQARLAEIKQRIEEIKAMDKSQLTRPERRELRAELKGLRKESASYIDVLYIGLGAIVILILILLIVLR